MKFFVDTAEIDQIRELNDLGMVDGVTTNPSLIKKSGRDIIEVTKEICAMVSGPVSAEVTSTDADTMIAEGRKLVEIAPNIAVAAKAGASFISPFIGRLDDINLDGLELIENIRTIYDNYGFDTEIPPIDRQRFGSILGRHRGHRAKNPVICG